MVLPYAVARCDVGSSAPRHPQRSASECSGQARLGVRSTLPSLRVSRTQRIGIACYCGMPQEHSEPLASCVSCKRGRQHRLLQESFEIVIPETCGSRFWRCGKERGHEDKTFGSHFGTFPARSPKQSWRVPFRHRFSEPKNRHRILLRHIGGPC